MTEKHRLKRWKRMFMVRPSPSALSLPPLRPPSHLHLHLLHLPRHSPWHMLLLVPGQHRTPCSPQSKQNSLLTWAQIILPATPSPLLSTSYKKDPAGSTHPPHTLSLSFLPSTFPLKSSSSSWLLKHTKPPLRAFPLAVSSTWDTISWGV